MDVAADLGVWIVDEMSVNPLLSKWVMEEGPVGVRKIVHGRWGTNSSRGVDRKVWMRRHVGSWLLDLRLGGDSRDIGFPGFVWQVRQSMRGWRHQSGYEHKCAA